MQRTLDIGLSAALVLLIGWVAYQGTSFYLTQATGWDLPRGWGRQAGLFPAVVGTPAFILALIQLIRVIRRPAAAGAVGTAPEPSLAIEDAGSRSVAIIATMFGFAAAIWLLGFVIAVPLATFVYLRFVAKESWRMSVGLASGAGLVFYFFFVELVGVAIPDGLLIEALFY